MNTLKIEAALAAKYHYRPLPDTLSSMYREYFASNVPDFVADCNQQMLCTLSGTPLCSGYKRIVIGDYGAFVEFDAEQANSSSFIVAPGQEYRIHDSKYANVKYHWYTVDDGSRVKIYHQMKAVAYADYIPGMYYVSVHEVARYGGTYNEEGFWKT